MKAKKKLFHKVMKQMDKKWIFTNPQKNYTAHACACVCVCMLPLLLQQKQEYAQKFLEEGHKTQIAPY
jgi:hypothetical protein